MKKILALMVIVLILFSACAAGPNNMKNAPDAEGEVAGFLNGVWHGIITPVTFIISLFNNNVNVYETHNNGGWYNFGFVIGLSIIFGGSSGSASRGSRRRRER